MEKLMEDKTWSHWKKVVDMVIKPYLKTKKFLLVVDGEISNTDWRNLLSMLPEENNNGSRVVRIIQGSHNKPDGIHDCDWISVMHFDKQETREFFEKWVSVTTKVNLEKGNPGSNRSTKTNGGQEDSEDNINEKTMCADLYNVTGGLPLAIVTLCGLLQTKEYPNGWVKVFKHLMNRQSNQSKLLDTILTMCFDDLPHDLKSCLLYFAVLPKNTAVDAHKLLCMWMAEGFLRPKDGRTMEKMGRIYLKDLVARNLVKVVKKDSFSGDEFVAVHHKIHAFLQGEAQEANFVDIYNCADMPSLANARRLSLQNYSDKYAALANPMPKLRSILSSFQQEEVGEEEDKLKSTVGGVQRKKGDEVTLKCFRLGCGEGTNDRRKHIRRMFEESRFLRVINLQGVEIGSKLPRTIRNVPHLQYLGVTACSLEFIPHEIGELKDLQTLDVRDTKVKKLPNSFWKITTLRHIFGTELTFPKKVGSLKNLQTLETIRPDEKHGWDENTFEKMVHLQSLYVSDTSSDPENVKALFDVIADPKLFEYLEKLVLHVTRILPVVFTSHSQRRLRAMSLCGELEMPKGTSGILEEFVPNLTFLSLKNTKVSQDFIRKLGKLPLLANLILDEDSYRDEGHLLDFKDGEFTRLKKLTLSHLKDLEKIVIGKTALLELTDLVILSCNAIKDIQVNGMCKCVQETKGVDDANLSSNKKPTQEIEGNVLKKMKGDDPKVCSRCTFVEKIKAEDKELYGHISQNFKSSSGLLHAADKRP
jgi:Leucine-rich repeat (LRR) protein